MPHTAKTHNEFRDIVCGVCLRKPKLFQKITPLVLSLIQKYHWKNYCLDDDFCPLIACKSCVATMKAVDKVTFFLSFHKVVFEH